MESDFLVHGSPECLAVCGPWSAADRYPATRVADPDRLSAALSREKIGYILSMLEHQVNDFFIKKGVCPIRSSPATI
jgi:hypothetical protein